ncbi:Asp-tRNA(Asn)/Glu-tRNA(Gln) amidotransferase subunit GatA [Patescibacteria group bacterium]|nr:Asp-tRNA(Asn)/Glu-tRNA(Gln) amidotransferase subunit GatA [Patescibacteria group bacterium]
MDLTKSTIKQAHEGLKKKEFSCVELTQAFLDRIEIEDKKIEAFLTVTKELALTQAQKVDLKIKKKEKISILEGIPMVVKDNIMVKGEKCTCASKILKDYIAPYDATVIKKLKDLGAVILGKMNMDEFAMGTSTENSAFKITKNPHNLERVPGGSSGGSAVAVADNMCCYALGSDTGGSVRQPASFCGVVGLKPTYGSVSRYGLVAYASSLDQIGPITKTVEDAQIVFEAISGVDAKDSTSINFKIDNSKVGLKGLKIGVPREYFSDEINYQTKEIIKEAIEKAKEQGAKIIEISLPNLKYSLATYYLIATSEASSNLSRFDGVKYGLSKMGETLLETYLQTKQEGFGEEVKRRIMLGTYALSSGYYDAYYLKAQKVRTLIKQDFEKAFKKVDVIFSPVAPSPAFKIGEKINDPLSLYLEDIFTVSPNLTGLPAVSVPVGKLNNLPVGLQIIGKPFEENKILDIAKIYA